MDEVIMFEGIVVSRIHRKGMSSIDSLLQKYKKEPIKKVNALYELAAEVGKITNSSPKRWFREVRDHSFEISRALIDLKEIMARGEVKSPGGYFIFLLKKHKQEQDGNARKQTEREHDES